MTKPSEKTREELTAEIEDEKKKSGSLKIGKRHCGKLYFLFTAVGVFCYKQCLFP